MTALVLGAAKLHGPYIDWASLSPIIALAAGGLIVLLAGLFRAAFVRTQLVPLLTVATLATALGLTIWRFDHPRGSIIAGALAIDDLAFVLDLVFIASALAAVVLSWRSHAAEEAGHGEYFTLLLFSVMGMFVFVAAQNLITLFVGIELLSIPLYVLCASESRRENSLESGLKYLVVGSVGSATLLYGLAMVYGATGSMGFSGISRAIGQNGIFDDPLLLTGIGLVTVGFAFKASVAPFHQWTPDVYEGAPTPVTAFMATATKAAALGAFLRFFDVAVIGQSNQWAPLLAALAAVTIIVGNVGALGQSSLKRMLAYSSVAQAGYMLGGVVVGTRLGVQATVFYIAVYLVMNIAAFAVIVARERALGAGGAELDGRESVADDIGALTGLGASSPALAAALTVALLSLAGIPGTVGFIGKFRLIQALVDGQYVWLAVVLVIGSMLSLAYYLRVVVAMWMPALVGVAPRPAIAGGSPELDELPAGAGAGAGADTGAGAGAVAGVDAGGTRLGRSPETVAVACLFALASVVLGIVPGPVFHLVDHAGSAVSGLF